MGEIASVLPFLPKTFNSTVNSVELDYPAPPNHRLELTQGFPVSGQMR